MKTLNSTKLKTLRLSNRFSFLKVVYCAIISADNDITKS